MAKAKKKRNKVYRGEGAKATTATVTRISAANRSALGQWWFDRKKALKPILIAAAVVLVVAWLIFELIRFIASL
ncbi:MAG TPA: hypothetical protein PLY16_02025 [Candidatus Saccharibacteria bacterium]|nr:hypothetical protein [Candidatus Saccharibacteria bacterium]